MSCGDPKPGVGLPAPILSHRSSRVQLMLLPQGPGFILVAILLAAAPLAQAPCLSPDGRDSNLACLPYNLRMAHGEPWSSQQLLAVTNSNPFRSC